MADGRRARAEQVAKRVNTATELLDAGMDVIDQIHLFGAKSFDEDEQLPADC